MLCIENPRMADLRAMRIGDANRLAGIQANCTAQAGGNRVGFFDHWRTVLRDRLVQR